MIIRLIRQLTRFILFTIAQVELVDYQNLPKQGGCIVICNHIGKLDAWLGFVLTNRNDTIIMVANKYEKNRILRFLGNRINTVWVNREETDFRALRQVQKRLQAGGLAVIAPEGRRSPTESLMAAKPGAAYLASKVNVPVVPIGLVGTEDSVVRSRLKRLKRLDLQVRFGRPFNLPPIPKADRSQFFIEATDEMMCQIAALLPESHRGVYAGHPRLGALLAHGSSPGAEA